MHGTLNGFGLTFPQSFLGVKLPFSLSTDAPLVVRPSYFIRGQSFEPPPPPPAPPAPTTPCLGGIVGECGSSPTGKCTPDRDLKITCKPGSGKITGIVFASWGTPTGTCSGGFAASSCNDTRAYGVAVAACVGKTACAITPSAFCSAEASTLDPACPFNGEKDPCLGKTKHLAVKASGCDAMAPPPPPPSPPAAKIPPLTAASGSVNTKHGVVNVSWVDDGSSPVTLDVSVPIGTVAEVWLIGKASAVAESGKPAREAEGVSLLREAPHRGEDYSVWRVDSGSYAFSSHR